MLLQEQVLNQTATSALSQFTALRKSLLCYCEQIFETELSPGHASTKSVLDRSKKLVALQKRIEGARDEFVVFHRAQQHSSSGTTGNSPLTIASRNFRQEDQFVGANNNGHVGLAPSKCLRPIVGCAMSFNFRINDSFLSATNHPITIPRGVYDELINIGLVPNPCPRGWKYQIRAQSISGKVIDGYIYCAVSGGGRYAQIKVMGDQADEFIRGVARNQRIDVRIVRQDTGKMLVSLSRLNH